MQGYQQRRQLLKVLVLQLHWLRQKVQGIVKSAAAGNVIPGYNGAASKAGFFSKNPMATMVLGQAGAGAIGSYEERRAMEEQRKEDEKIRNERGLMGVDHEGNYRGQGIVNSQSVASQETAQQATQAPTVQGQSIAAQQPVNRPIDRKNLPQLKKQGLIAQQQVS